MQHSATPTRPSVLIVGAGIGGLTLGALLEKAGVPYQIYERSVTSNPVGSAIRLSASVMPMLKQLGLLDRLTAISKIANKTRLYTENHDLLGTMDFYTGMPERFQYPRLLMSRPELYEMLLEQIPKDKIHYGKKLLSHEETETGVLLSFSDNTTAEGSILVGADGANSSVRQNMYRQLEKVDLLPASDKLPLKYSSISLVGQTSVLDPQTYSALKDKFCDPRVIISDSKPLVIVIFTTAQNTVCWMVVEFLDKETSKLHDNFRSSEWGPEAAEAMAKEEDIRRIIIPGGGGLATMAELIDLTPRELMSKVMLEEKLFKTWTSGRTVLIGDSCHKMSPAAAQGAANAMLDATILANYIEALKNPTLADIEASFQAFKNERFDGAKAAVDGSAAMMRLFTKGLLGTIVRTIMLDPPKWLWNLISGKTEGYRPQVAFLPQVPDNGTVKTPYQPSLHLPTSTRPAGVAV